jgi:hypothetical protein
VKKISTAITEQEFSTVFDEGRAAFTDGRRRAYNPYIGKGEELTDAWWEGWDQVKNDAPSQENPCANYAVMPLDVVQVLLFADVLFVDTGLGVSKPAKKATLVVNRVTITSVFDI